MKRIILLLLFLAACTTGPSGPTFTGTEGVSIEFTKGYPADESYESSPVPVSLEIKNEGTWNVLPHRMLLSWSYDPLYLSNNDGLSAYPLNRLFHARTPAYPDGDSIYVEEFGFVTNKVVGQREAPETDLFALVCYEYVTRFAEGVCIDVDSYLRTGREQVCEGQDVIASSQGGPIAFTHVEINARPVQSETNFPAVSPEIIATIRNVGGGTVLAPSTDAYDTAGFEKACRLEVDSSLLNGVAVQGEIFGYPLTCTPSVVRLLNGEGRVRCSIDTSAFETSRKTSALVQTAADEESRSYITNQRAYVDKCADPEEYRRLTPNQRAECDKENAADFYGEPWPSLDFDPLVQDCMSPLLVLDAERMEECQTLGEGTNLLTLQNNIMTVLTLEARYIYRASAEHTLTIRRNDFDEPEAYTGVAPKQKGYAYDSNNEIMYNKETGKTLTLCDQYAGDPSLQPKDLPDINSEFTCACGRNECVAMDELGFCVHGICPGTRECCDKAAYESYIKATTNTGRTGEDG